MRRIPLILFLFFILVIYGENLTVTFLNIHQGDSILISTPAGKHYLIDGGQPAYYDPIKHIYYSHFDAGRDIIIPYLKKLNIKKLDGVLGTHPDADHIGGLVYVLNHFPVDNVYYNGKMHTSITFKNFMLAIKNHHIKYHELRDGDLLNWDKNILVQVLGPAENELKYPNGNNNTSIVLYIRYGNRKFILTGDAEFEEEKRIVEEYGDNIKADVLKFGHHGSKTASSTVFLKAVNPTYGIISCGRHNKFGFPHKETLLRIYKVIPHIKIVRTDYNGNISFITDGKNLIVKPEKGKIYTMEEVLKQEHIYLNKAFIGIDDKKENISVFGNNKKIDINKASQKELESLPRIGPKTALNIINYRNENGPFSSIKDIMKVPRIGTKTFEKIEPYIMVSSYKKNNDITDKKNNNIKKININKASQKELESLPRIGPKTALNIINYRKQNGPFKDIHDIMKVPRIGNKTFEAIKEYICVE